MKETFRSNCVILGLFDPTLAPPCGLEALLSCGDPAGPLAIPFRAARLTDGENAGPPTGVVGADSDCLSTWSSSANQTLLFPFGDVPGKKMPVVVVAVLKRPKNK